MLDRVLRLVLWLAPPLATLALVAACASYLRFDPASTVGLIASGVIFGYPLIAMATVSRETERSKGMTK